MNPIAFDPTQMLSGAIALVNASRPLIAAVGLAAGLAFILKAGLLCRNGEGRGNDEVPVMQVAVLIFCGGLLIQISRTVFMTQELLGGAGGETRTAMLYMASQASAGNPVFTLGMQAALMWLGLIGVAGVFRGVVLWRSLGRGENAGGGGDPFTRGLVHILAGGLCVNIGWGNV